MNTGKTVLVIEDEKQLSQALYTKLLHEGFRVLQAFDGEEGLMLALTKHPDLILMDIVMPKMDGMTVLTRLREDQWGKDALVIIMSNLSDGVKIDEGLQKNIVGYIIKSDWKLHDIINKVKYTLNIQ